MGVIFPSMKELMADIGDHAYAAVSEVAWKTKEEQSMAAQKRSRVLEADAESSKDAVHKKLASGVLSGAIKGGKTHHEATQETNKKMKQQNLTERRLPTVAKESKSGKDLEFGQ